MDRRNAFGEGSDQLFTTSGLSGAGGSIENFLQMLEESQLEISTLQVNPSGQNLHVS